MSDIPIKQLEQLRDEAERAAVKKFASDLKLIRNEQQRLAAALEQAQPSVAVLMELAQQANRITESVLELAHKLAERKEVP